MPTYTILGKGPVTFPDGMSREEIEEAIHRNLALDAHEKLLNMGNGSAPSESTPADVAPNPVETMPSQNSKKTGLLDKVKNFDRATTEGLYNAAKSVPAAISEGMQRALYGPAQLAFQGIDKLFGSKLASKYDAERQGLAGQFKKQYPGIVPRSVAAATEIVPYLAVPGGIEGKFLTRGLTGAAAGAGTSFLQPAQDVTSRLKNAEVGAGLGGLAGGFVGPMLGSYAKLRPSLKVATGAGLAGLVSELYGNDKYKSGLYSTVGGLSALSPGLAAEQLRKVLGKKEELGPISDIAARSLFKTINPQEALVAKEAADRLGIPIRPHEAVNDNNAGVIAGHLKQNKYGAEKITQFEKNRTTQEKNAITSFIKEISPNGASGNEKVREVAQDLLEKKRSDMLKKSTPHYEKAFGPDESPNLIPDDIFQKIQDNKLVKHAIGKVKTDPEYQEAIKGLPENSYKFMDLVKQNLDENIKIRIKQDANFKARENTTAKRHLTDLLDQSNSDYKMARSIYSEDAKPLQKLKSSDLGRIANLPDHKIQAVSKTIFDNADTDIDAFKKLRDNIQKENPEAWNTIVRNEMERRMRKSGDTYGSSFFNKVLKDDVDFNKFKAATEHIPGANQKLDDMRSVFKYLTNPRTAKSAEFQSSINLDNKRSDIEWAKDIAKNVLFHGYNKALTNIIVSPTWDKELKQVMKEPKESIRSYKFAQLIARIASIEHAQHSGSNP